MQSISMQIGYIAATVGGIAVIIGGVAAIYKLARRIETAIGADKDGRTLAERMTRVEYQLWENGGESMADRVNRIEKHSETTSTEVSFIKDIMLKLVSVPDIPPAHPDNIKPVKTRKKKSTAA